VLTIDESIQYVAESELDRAMAETQAIAGVVVVLDPRTGEILALANRPTFNPNRFAAFGSSRWKNRAVVDAYEPGSMFKVVTAAAALQQKVVEPEEVIDCGGGAVDVAGVRINDHAVFHDLTFREVIAKSSDVGAVRVAQRLGRDNFDRYMRDFGFGAITGIDLPGESSGLLRPTSKWSALSLASISFGQEVGVTALQMAVAVGAIANGGYLMKPLIVRQLENGAGRVLKTAPPVAVRRVIDTETADTLTRILRTVVTAGTGRHAAIPGYVVAGKTGTAQKIDAQGRYSMIDHVASFVGYVPASRPALVILVSLDTPRGARNEGGDVAAPIFARVAEHALARLAIPPDDLDRVWRVSPYKPSNLVPAAYTPNGQNPGATAPPLPLGREGRGEGVKPFVDSGDPGLMPDVRGLSAREAALTAARRGLLVELKGSGRVVSQTPEPGTEIEAGTRCVLMLDRPS
jgi:cell division protein FtsI (penicillin-binding protein 3)